MKIIYPVPEALPDPRARFIQIVNTCLAFAKKGIKVQLLVGIKKGYSTDEVLGFYGISQHPNLEVISLPLLRHEYAHRLRLSWNGVFYFFLLLYLLSKTSRRELQTILFLRYLKLANFILRFKRVLNIPVLFEVHEIFHLTTHNLKKKERLRDIESGVYSRADLVISISQSIKDVLVQMGIPTETIHVVHNGINPQWFDIEKAPEGSYICYTGSLYRWKGVDVLISAMKYLPEARLVVVGGGKRLQELHHHSVKEGVSGRVSFVGAVPHGSIPDYLSHAAVAILPNIPSGPSQFSSPLKLFEYMACGIPIVASNLPVFREILTHKKNAIFVEPNNPEALASGIRFILQNPDIGKNIAEKAKKDAMEFTYETKVGRILASVSQMRSEK
jgi:glycosyltransferase involved in cell wall biosynthesis